MNIFLAVQSKYKVALILFGMTLCLMGGIFLERYWIGRSSDVNTSIYKDRLIPSHSVLLLYDHLNLRYHYTQAARFQSDIGIMDRQYVQSLAAESDSIITAFKNTYLVTEENAYLTQLVEDLKTYSQLESDYLAGDISDMAELSAAYRQVRSTLLELGVIQASVGEDLWSESESIQNQSEWVIQALVVLLISLFIIIQMLILSSKSAHSPISQNYPLN